MPSLPRSGSSAEQAAEMPFLDHLEELRWRIIRSLIALIVGIAAGWFLLRRFDVVGFLARPAQDFLPQGQTLVFTSPLYPFILTLKLSFVFGLLLALPVVLYQVWGFLRPALYRNERNVVLPVGVLSVLLFAAGGALAFYVVLPLTLDIMKGFTHQSLTPFITADQYLGLTTALILGFGAVFQMPLILLLLVYLRVVSAAFLRRHRRTFVIVNAILSAVLTPGDIVIMTVVVMVPIQLFYELAVVAALIMERRREKATAGAPGTPEPGTPAPGAA